jgi:hypothetical protein
MKKCPHCSKEHENNNTGCLNSGNRNSGNRNSGNRNSGNRNLGNRNSGDYNSGYYNSGDCNSGNRNSGDYNSGYYNLGDYNSGNRNLGDCNSGNRNSGDYNSGNRNSGWFNTDEPKMHFFNKESDVTYSEFSKGVKVYPDLKICAWVDVKDLLKDEQTIEVTQRGGTLKTLAYKEAWKEYWNRASESDKEWFKSLPNFDESIFEEVTGIKVNEKIDTATQEAIKLLEKNGFRIVKE